MRTPEDVKFILARVLEHIHAHPPLGPLLVETPPTRPSRTCKRSHVGAPRGASGKCMTCDREQKAARRGRHP